jgi:hypothetical protein
VTSKGIGFDRNIRVAWLDATAAACLETSDVGEVRAQLMTYLEADLASREGRLKTARLLAKIWHGTASSAPTLHAEALRLFATAETAGDRIWLHYGLTLVAFPFFRDVAATVGRTVHYGDEVTSGMIRARLFADRGQIAIIEKSAERALFFMRQLGLLVTGSSATTYAAAPSRLRTTNPVIRAWLISAVVHTQPSHQVAADDLSSLPEFFGFDIGRGLDVVRSSPLLEVERQGSSWDLVRAAG